MRMAMLFTMALALAWQEAALAQGRKLTQRSEATVNVRSGERKRVAFFWQIAKDCSTHKGFSVNVPTQPENGSVVLEKTVQVVTIGMARFARNDGHKSRYETAMACLGKPIQVISLYYRSNPRFRVSDRFEYVSTYPPAFDQWRRTYRMYVH